MGEPEQQHQRWRTIVIDPPWVGQGADHHYDVLSFRRLQSLPVADLTQEHAHLWLWCTNGTLAQAMQLIHDWSFTYHGIITWAKLRPGKPTQYLQATTELLLFATKGRGPEIAARRRGQGTLLLAPLGIHSEKPDEALAIYERVSYPPFAGLFARVRPNSRTRWAIWGNEVDSDFSIPGFPVGSDFARQETDE